MKKDKTKGIYLIFFFRCPCWSNAIYNGIPQTARPRFKKKIRLVPFFKSSFFFDFSLILDGFHHNLVYIFSLNHKMVFDDWHVPDVLIHVQ